MDSNRTLKINFTFVCLSLFLLSCERMNSENAKVTIDFPASQSSSLNQFKQISMPTFNQKSLVFDLSNSQRNNNLENQKWNDIEPTGLASDSSPNNTAPINCYFVALGWPENSSNSNACYKKLGGTSPREVKFKFGLIAGPVPAGQSISFEASAGKDRVLYLMGMHAIDEDYCVSFSSEDFSKQNMSRPYNLGQISNVQLLPGLETQVPITMTFDSDKSITGCDLVLPGEDDEPPPPISSKFIALKWVGSPHQGGHLGPNQCVPFQAYITDESGIVREKSTSPISLALANGFTTYDSYSNCLDGGSAEEGFSIPANKSGILRWVSSTTFSSATELALQMPSSVSGTVSAPLVYHTDNNIKFPVASIPKSMLPNICYPIQFTTNNIEKSGPNKLDQDNFLITSESSEIQFFLGTDPNCQDSGLDEIHLNYSSENSENKDDDVVYFKYIQSANVNPNTQAQKAVIKFNNNAGESQTTQKITELTTVVRQGPISSYKLSFQETELHLKRNTSDGGYTCHGPFRLFIANKVGDEVKATTSGMEFKVDYKKSDSESSEFLKVAKDPLCEDLVSFEQVHHIESDNSAAVFYLKVVDGDTVLKRELKILRRNSPSSPNFKKEDAKLKIYARP